MWFEKYTEKYANIQFNYQSIGSGGGVTQITQQTVDFGASDAALKDEEIAKLPAGTKILHVPTALGAVVVIYNLPGVDKLQLDSANIADIFLGNITKWNDAKIAANNAGVTLPDQAIQVVHRQDGSGTTNAFTAYLDTVSPDWHTKVGAGKEVKWPVGQGAQGNDGVANGVKQSAGAVGYVELQYATQAKLSSAYVKNADGQFVAGSTDGVTAAADAAVAKFPADFRQAPIINGAGATHLSDRVVHVPAWLRGPDEEGQGSGPGLVHVLGPHRRPGPREGPRLRSSARGRRPEVARGAPPVHQRAARRSGPDRAILTYRSRTRRPADLRSAGRPISLPGSRYRRP